jgi:Domain of unknown function (DUF1996)
VPRPASVQPVRLPASLARSALPAWSRVTAVAVAACLTLMVATVISAPPAHASSPGWITICPPTHSAMNDPIVFPRQPGASHLHQFFGNRSVTAFSTYRSMLAGHTSCGTKADRAGYWVPALYEDGRLVRPRGLLADGEGHTRSVFYYRVDNISDEYLARHPVQPFPRNFRMIAGDAHVKSAAAQKELGSEIYWGCSDNSTDKLTAPPSCETGAISLHVGFPNCWSGDVTSRGVGRNDTPNVVYPDDDRCPRRYPHVLPRLIFRVEYPVGTTTGRITLASGPAYTMHADFWNTWRQPALARLVNECLRAGVDCGNNPHP